MHSAHLVNGFECRVQLQVVPCCLCNGLRYGMPIHLTLWMYSFHVLLDPYLSYCNCLPGIVMLKSSKGEVPWRPVLGNYDGNPDPATGCTHCACGEDLTCIPAKPWSPDFVGRARECFNLLFTSGHGVAFFVNQWLVKTNLRAVCIPASLDLRQALLVL